MSKPLSAEVSKGGALSEPAEDDDEDDTISLTSTVSEQHDPDQEFVVEDILAERPNDEGDKYFLVQWTGFPMHECTWEPEENLGDELKQIWNETKEKEARGESEPFDVRIYWDAVEDVKHKKAERHQRRNAKRKRLGLPLTEPIDSVARPIAAASRESSAASPAQNEVIPRLDSSSSSEDEAVEDNHVENDVPAPVSLSRPTPKQKLFKGVHNANTPSGANRVSVGKPPATTKSSNSAKTASADKSSSSSSLAKQRRRPETSSSTSYQGAARKPAPKAPPANSSSAIKPSSAISRGPSRIGRAASGISRGGMKGVSFTAKKSSSGVDSNVFVAGRIRKSRAGLKDRLSDNAQEPSLFGRVSIRRRAELIGREKEDHAPSFAQLNPNNFFNITEGPGARRPSLIASERRRGSNSSASPIVVDDGQAVSPSAAMTEAAQDEAPRKKRRSVRFADEAALADDMMELDSPSPQDQPQMVQRPVVMSGGQAVQMPLSSEAKKPSWSEHRARSLRSLEKQIKIGPQQLHVRFEGVPQGMLHPSLDSFVEDFKLEFSYTCLALAFDMQAQHLVQERLCEGSLTASGNEVLLENAAQHLRSTLTGLFLAKPGYSVLLFPTKCEAWKSQGDQDAGAAALRFLVFNAANDTAPWLRPIDAPVAGMPDSSSNSVPVNERSDIMQRFFGFDYAKLVPTPFVEQLDSHKFFLAFPVSKGKVCHALHLWLSACNPRCQIYSSLVPGDWTAFRGNKLGAAGIVIVHELALPAVRRFPQLGDDLRSQPDQYWCFSEALYPKPMFPSIVSDSFKAEPGKLDFVRLFPHGTIIFLTPSFLVSEPQRAYELLAWFISHPNRKKDYKKYKLATAWNIVDYLEGLAEEKVNARAALVAEAPHDKALKEDLRGLSREDCEWRLKLCVLASYLQDKREAEAMPFLSNEEQSPLVYADSSIDPNDEQSLVNWFGWWSTMHMDQYRKFCVVGSSQSMVLHDSERGERVLEIPIYTQDTVNDPDNGMDVASTQQQDLGRPSDETDLTRRSNAAAIPKDPRQMTFQSAILRSDKSFEISNYLQDVHKRLRQPGSTLYTYPISHLDYDMAASLGEASYRDSFKTIQEWFSFPWSFKLKFHTYIGLFYTIGGEWESEKRSHGARPPRHPWLAIYRLAEPHMRPFVLENRPIGCELIIWDCLAGERLTGDKESMEERDLCYMQRRLIQYVREHSEDKNPGLPLDRVWFGNRMLSPTHEKSPMDRTLAHIEAILGNLNHVVPAAEKSLQAAGYVLVRPENNKGSSIGDPMDTSSDYKEAPDTRIIFHPPRGTRLPPGQKTRCINQLHEEARIASLRNTSGGRAESMDATRMTFRFRPTMQWYEEQLAEGRGFQHINVDSWQSIFNYFKIGGSTGSLDSPDRRDSNASA